MTRINVIPVESLCQQHLCAEYRELPRVFALAHKASQSSKPWPCVPWLGCGGELGKCIYCGKSVCCNSETQ